MVSYIETWFSELPVITKGLFLIYLITGIIAAFWPSFTVHNYFLFNSNRISIRLTSFLYIGNFMSVGFWYELILFVIYSKSLEYEYLHFNSRKYYFVCLLFGTLIILFLSLLKPLETYFLSESFVFYIIYLFNNYKNPNGTTVFLPALSIENKYMTVFLILVGAVFRYFWWTEYFIGITAGYIFMKLEQVGIVRDILGYF